ncbi:MAG: hypothetical protein ACRD9R_19335 [Pyrinomonadaceae bacterium]
MAHSPQVYDCNLNLLQGEVQPQISAEVREPINEALREFVINKSAGKKTAGRKRTED